MERLSGAIAAGARIAQEPRSNVPIVIQGIAEQFSNPDNLVLTGTALSVISALYSVGRLVRHNQNRNIPSEPRIPRIRVESLPRNH